MEIKHVNMSNRDVDQIHRYEHDECQNSRRVTVVNVEGLKEGIVDSLKGLKIEFPQDMLGRSPQVQTVNIPQIFKEVQIQEVPKVIEQVRIERIEVPVIVKETEVKYIDRPVITEVVKFVDAQKTIVVTDYKNLPKWIFLSQAVFVALNLGLLVFLVLK